MKILAIGNSFSQDATVYLAQLSAMGGKSCRVVNLHIGGCSLERHHRCIEEGLCDYSVWENGVSYGELGRSADWLKKEDWDIVTLQQASGYSGIWESYLPHLDVVADTVRTLAPGAQLWIHKTWAYETNSDHRHFPNYDNDTQKMHDALSDCYARAAERLGVGIIPSGDVIHALKQTPAFSVAQGGISLHRDGYHLSHTYGRWVAALTWYATLLGGDAKANPFLPPLPDKIAWDRELVALCRETVDRITKK